MDEAGNRNEFLDNSYRIFSYAVCFFFVKTKVVTLGHKYVIAGIMIPYFVQVGGDVVRFVFLFSFCHVQRIGDVTVVGNTAVFSHFQVVIVEYKVHVVFVSPIAGKQSSVEECCGLAGIETASVEIINIKTDTESLVGIDGKVGFETLFTVTAIESFIIAQVGKGRKRIGKYDIFRAEYGKVVWIGKKELTGIPTVEKKTRQAGRA